MAYDDQDVDRLLRALPAPGVPARTRERQLELLRAAMAADAEAPTSTAAGRSGGRAGRGDGRARSTVPRRRRRVVIAVVAAAAVGLGATAAATIAWQRASNRTEVALLPRGRDRLRQPGLRRHRPRSTRTRLRPRWRSARACGGQGDLVSAPPYLGPGPAARSRSHPWSPACCPTRGGRVPHHPDLRGSWACRGPADDPAGSARAEVSTSWTPCNAAAAATYPVGRGFRRRGWR